MNFRGIGSTDFSNAGCRTSSSIFLAKIIRHLIQVTDGAG
jgi:hypothetical protein